VALSNWDTLAFGPEGTSSRGEYASPKSKASISIYKNWLYVHDQRLKSKKNDGAVAATVEHGKLSYGDLSIEAIRHKGQSSVFVLVRRGYKEGDNYKLDYFGGIGCCAFLSSAEWYRRHDPETLARALKKAKAEWFDPDVHHYHDFTHYEGDDKSVHGISIIKDEKCFDVVLGFEDHDTFVGVEATTYEAWVTWVESLCDEYSKALREWIDKVKAGTPMRYNQGDAFFADQGMADEPSTPIGKQASTTVMMQMLGNDQ
jgi:hypothetical protein